ncbi:PREDICTED: uncharacterized protein LOC108556695 isoform X2 [Nicrophorus vespilloides]|uniref:Uncharacterized protein LOC108556695 isoform X2 n=1 Tax=Nicrophorus vespilloides TaxID=110193 RepID=A0ABM1M1E2_NICVS|nr:PREDICTED: uncharacterized protein LOC108556695 isoform X2 [Nicrophorus vespilloides]
MGLGKVMMDLCGKQNHCDLLPIQTFLRDLENDETLVVQSCRSFESADVAEHFVSEIYRVEVTGFKKNEDKQQVKCRLRNEAVVKEFNFEEVYKNEWLAYTRILPILNKNASGDLPIPRCFYADPTMLVLEDLSVLGYKTVDIVEPFTVQHVESTLCALAKLHSASMIMEENDYESLEALSVFTNDVVYNHGDVSNPAKYQKLNIDLAIAVFKELGDSDENYSVLEKLNRLKDICFDLQKKLVCTKRPYRVINHGDAWFNNIMLKDGKAMLLDLQIMRFTSPAVDLSYFLYVNLKPSMRRENLDRFLDVYLENLEGVKRSKNWLVKEMKEFAVVGFINALWLLPLFYFKKEFLGISQEMTRSDQEYINMYLNNASFYFKERLREIVIDFFNHEDCPLVL